jgi:hypothetical protein
MLYHVSETADINEFEPRWSEAQGAAIVWAVHERRLHNYLLPRNCPRVCYTVNSQTSPADVAQFVDASQSVVAIESRWVQRMQSTTLYLYELPEATFRECDEGAGYHISEQRVVPVTVTRIDNPMRAILERGVELRLMRDLLAFGDQVVASTLQFSLIRMRNAGGDVG